MHIKIETKNLEITSKFYRYIESRVKTLLETSITDIKTLKVKLSKTKLGIKHRVLCQIIITDINDSSMYAEYRADEITIALETAINQLRIKLYDRTKKQQLSQPRIRLLKQNRNKIGLRQYREFNQQIIGA